MSSADTKEIETVDSTMKVLTHSGVIYPLLIALAILLYTVYENRRQLQAYLGMLRSRMVFQTVSWTGMVLLAGLAHRALATSPSSVLTVGGALTLHAFACLTAGRGVGAKANAVGASPVMFLLLGLSLVVRLSCTLRVSAYLPDDSTGDWLYQALEIATLVLVAREYLVWQDFPEQSAPVSPHAFTLAAMGVVAAAVAGSQCHGDLANRPLVDQAYMTAVYLEVVAWVFQAAFMLDLPKEQMNVQFLAAAALGVACRTRFWDLASPEILPQKPDVKLAAYFPKALVLCHFAKLAIATGLCLLAILKRVLQYELRAPTGPWPAVRHVPPTGYAMPPGGGYAAMPRHPMEMAGCSPHHVAPGLVPDIREPLPAGATQFVPIASEYKNGILTVHYQPM